MPASLTVLFMPESAYGPTNNCIGIGDCLLQRGHRVVFAAEASWTWQARAARVRGGPRRPRAPPAGTDRRAAGRRRSSGRTSSGTPHRSSASRPSSSSARSCSRPGRRSSTAPGTASRSCGRSSRASDPTSSSRTTSSASRRWSTDGRPFVRIVTCNPLEVPGPDIPPTFSGLPADDRRVGRVPRGVRPHPPRDVDRLRRLGPGAGRAPLPDLDFIHASADLNLYVYPDELDYTGRARSDATWHRLDSSVRTTDAAFELPGRGRGPTGGQRPRLPLARLARQRRRRPHAAPGRRARSHAGIGSS